MFEHCYLFLKLQNQLKWKGSKQIMNRREWTEIKGIEKFISIS